MLRVPTRALRRREDGFALPLAVAAVSVLGLLAASVSYYVSRNVTAASRSVWNQKAQALADAGLNSALSVLEKAADPTNAASVPSPNPPPTLEGGTYTYAGSLVGSTWTLTGTGTYPASPAAGTTQARRTTSISVNIVQQPILDIWRYLYSDATGGCSTSIQPSTDVSAPLYVNGDLCVNNRARILSSPLQVDGSLLIDNNGSVGTAGTPLDTVSVGGQCLHGGAHACTLTDYNLYVTHLYHQAGTLTKPPLQLDQWYQNSNLGPLHPCAVGSIPGGFDVDTTRNGNRPTFDLTPPSGYDCRSADGAGRITWVPGPDSQTPGTLTVSGVVYFDGSIVMNVGALARYQGKASIYASGTILLDTGAHLCGNAACDSSWDANTNLLVLVVGSAASPALTMKQNAIYQGGAYVNGDYSIENNAVNWGPVIANHITIANNAGQTVPLNTLPPGAPAYYTTSLQVAPATYR
jgi:hypothetical protein